VLEACQLVSKNLGLGVILWDKRDMLQDAIGRDWPFTLLEVWLASISPEDMRVEQGKMPLKIRDAIIEVQFGW